MLILRRMIHPYEVRKCSVSNEFIVYGEYYYEDNEDPNVIVKASVYKQMQRDAKNEAFDYSELERVQSQAEYERLMKRAEQDYLRATILDRPIFDQGHAKRNGVD